PLYMTAYEFKRVGRTHVALKSGISLEHLDKLREHIKCHTISTFYTSKYMYKSGVSPILHRYGLTKRCVSGNIEEFMLVIQYAEDNSTTHKLYGVLPFVAPEIFTKKQFNPKSDVYSFGIIMWMFTSG
ncbi:2159_t:CDS:2, partial [Dentiscutata heterogama]